MERILGRANIVVKTEPLTEKTLLKEIFEIQENTFKLKKKKKSILKQLKYLYTEENCVTITDQQFIIYSLIRLWHKNRVVDYNFIESWKKYRPRIIILYRSWYNEQNIDEVQRRLVVV